MSARILAATALLLSLAGWDVRPAVAAARAPGGEVRLWAGGGGARVYGVDSVVLANEAARKDQEVGWRITGTLAVRAAACHQHEALLHFELRRPTLELRGAARHAEWFARPSAWDAPAQRASSFYAHWRTGEITDAYLDPADPPAIAGYKRALLSLFQFQILDGERNETDISGECSVLHETVGEYDFRKIKRGCRWQDTDSEAGGLVSRRLTRYTLRPALDALSAVHAEELHVLSAASHQDTHAAVKVRVLTQLKLSGEERAPACAPAEPGLRAHIDALPANLEQTSLPLTAHEETSDNSENEDLESEDAPLSLPAAIELAGTLSAGEAGAGGDVTTARTLLRVLPALTGATPGQLAPLLQRVDDIQRLTGVAIALGAVGSAATHEAAAAALQLRAEPLQPAADAYLSALATAPAPSDAAVRAVLATPADSKRLRTGALLAAASAAPRVSDALAAHVRDELAKQLARCKEDVCRSVRLMALGNLRRADTGELLVEHAVRGEQLAALAALHALQQAPARALPWARVERLLHLATNTSKPLTVRAAALDLAIRRSADYALGLTETARALHAEAGAHELRRVFWQRLHALAPQHEQVRVFLRAAHRQPELANWHELALAGTSSVLRREAGWGAGGLRATLDSTQLAAGGVLKRGVVSLALMDRDNHTHPALAVELWTRGLAALAGGSETHDESEQEEEAGGGLALEVLGARLPPVTLFSSQAELLGHVWSGAGSTPTPVLRAVTSLGARGAAVPVLGGVVARLEGASAAALALDAHAAVSLWSRTASARLQVRAGLAARSTARVSAPWGALSVRTEATAPATLRIAADLDFYDKVALCVRARVDDHAYSRRAALRSTLGARRWRVARRREQRTPRAGNTLALGRVNDHACRALTHHHQGDD